MASQPGFDWSAPDPTPVPHQAGSHTSFKAAAAVSRRGDRGLKVRRLLEEYAKAGEHGLNDSEAHERTGLPRQSICSLRGHLATCGLVTKAGERKGGFGINQQVWVITTGGRAAVRES
jgi:hypothetical protein